MDKTITWFDDGKKVVINTALITHMFIASSGVLKIFMASGNMVEFTDGAKFLTYLKILYPTIEV